MQISINCVTKTVNKKYLLKIALYKHSTRYKIKIVNKNMVTLLTFIIRLLEAKYM